MGMLQIPSWVITEIKPPTVWPERMKWDKWTNVGPTAIRVGCRELLEFNEDSDMRDLDGRKLLMEMVYGCYPS